MTVSRWVWGLAIGVPVAAALAYILFGPDSEVAIVEMISLYELHNQISLRLNRVFQEGGGKTKKAKKAKDEVKEAVKEEKKSAPAASKVKVTIFIELRGIIDGCKGGG